MSSGINQQRLPIFLKDRNDTGGNDIQFYEQKYKNKQKIGLWLGTVSYNKISSLMESRF